jgi:hypothetical protein
LKDISGAIETSCPEYATERETLCDNEQLVTALVDNKNYSAIGPLASQLTEQIALIKSVHNDRLGFLMETGLLKRCEAAVARGVETVAFTFFLFNTHRQWPKTLTNLPVARNAVKELRAELGKTAVIITPQMSTLLDAFACGDMLPDKVAARAEVAAAEKESGYCFFIFPHRSQ